MSRPELSRLRARLLRSGVAPRHVKRTVAELDAHFDDLVDGLQFGLDRGVDLFSMSGGWTQPDEDIRVALRNTAETLLAAGVPWFVAA